MSESMESAKRMAVELGLADPDEGAILAEEFGMGGKPPAEVRDLDVIEAEILFYKRQAGESILEIGKRLNEAKAQLGHGEWLPWLREKVDISERSAQNFMRLAKEYSKSAEIADLGASKALALLALSDSDRAEFVAETHEVNGVEKTAADMTTKELKQAIADRDRAVQDAEIAKAGQALAEQANEKMAVDMKHLKELTARAQEAESQKAVELAKVIAELEELKKKPVEVAVEVKDASAEQIEQAKKDARAEMEQRLKDEKRRAELELAKAREQVADAEERVEKAEREREKAEKAAKSSGGSTAKFRVLFDSTQKLVNEMADLMAQEEEENRAKMQRALQALAAQIGEVAHGK